LATPRSRGDTTLLAPVRLDTLRTRMRRQTPWPNRVVASSNKTAARSCEGNAVAHVR